MYIPLHIAIVSISQTSTNFALMVPMNLGLRKRYMKDKKIQIKYFGSLQFLRLKGCIALVVLAVLDALYIPHIYITLTLPTCRSVCRQLCGYIVSLSESL